MIAEINEDNILFVVETPLGFRVRVSRSSWERIVALKHPGYASKVKRKK